MFYRLTPMSIVTWRRLTEEGKYSELCFQEEYDFPVSSRLFQGGGICLIYCQTAVFSGGSNDVLSDLRETVLQAGDRDEVFVQ